MNSLENQSIGQIVAEDYRTAQIFHNHKLDFCCGGTKTVAEACEQNEINPQEVLKELTALGNDGTQEDNYNTWSLDFLTDYIINNHHQFTRSKLPEIGFYAKKVAKVHGGRHPELIKIHQEFEKLSAEMMEHMDKEEKILFPYIKKLVSGGISEADKFKVGSASDPIEMMEHEHDEAGASLAKIRELSNDFTLPEDACSTYTILFQNLEAFEKDMHKHVHLENNILFPKSLQLERRTN
ncbi:MAG TPA: iron-sulfur cluster repair di-iron protein [Balneolaceae bacterium]|nr:iron-sulfur cluster repair di-iron protein [Balneolaceae bacterium]